MRIDVPTLKCDRCAFTTQDLSVMGSFQELKHYGMDRTTKWDLCTSCWKEFKEFMDGRR